MPVSTGDRREVDWFAHALRDKLYCDARELGRDYDQYRYRCQASSAPAPKPVTPICTSSAGQVTLRTSSGVGSFPRTAVFCFVTLACLSGVRYAALTMQAPPHVKAAINDEASGLATTSAVSVVNHMDKVAETTGSWPDTKSLYEYARASGRNEVFQAKRVEMRPLVRYGLDQDVEDPRQRDVDVKLRQSLEEMSEQGYPTEIIDLRMQGYTNDEIADFLGVSERTIRNRVNESRRRLLESQNPWNRETESMRDIRLMREFYGGRPDRSSFTPSRRTRVVELELFPLAVAV